MSRNNKIMLAIIIALFIFACWTVFPIDGSRLGRTGLHQGLDLVGGVNLVYQGIFGDNVTASEQAAAMDREILTIQKRIDAFGVTEPIIQRLGNNRIQIQLPGFTDIKAAKSLVEQTGFLEFRVAEKNSSGAVVTLKDYLNQSAYSYIDTAEQGNRIFTIGATDNQGNPSYNTVAILAPSANGTLAMVDINGNPVSPDTLKQNSTANSWIPARGSDGTELTGAYLADAQSVLDTSGGAAKPAVSIKWNTQGSKIFDQIAAQIHNPQGSSGAYQIQYAIGIFLDDNLLSAPQILQASYGGTGQISGSFTTQKADQLAQLLKSGSLPVKLDTQPLYEQTVSATLGTDSLNRSLKAGIVGIIMVAFFMIAYYRYLGVVATLALMVYGVLSLTIFKLIPITLTLPGIAGFIISVGMAVDANVLIFERMKEEMRLGRTLEAGVAEGFRRAWPSIRDSNISTFITCIILYWFGSAFGAFIVKGFALTLFIGVAVSMFTAVTVTQTFLKALIHIGVAKKYLHGSAK